MGLDFTGIWWMRGNPVPEELASFAGAIVNASSFPVRMSVQNNRAKQWSWVNSLSGQALLKYYSVYDPLDTANIDFANTFYGSISAGLTDVPFVWVEDFCFRFINPDQWLLETIFQKGFPFPEHNYTLTRAIKGGGSAS